MCSGLRSLLIGLQIGHLLNLDGLSTHSLSFERRKLLQRAVLKRQDETLMVRRDEV